MKASNCIIKNLSFNSTFSALKELVVGILYHVTQFTKRIITNMVSKKITVKTTAFISQPCMLDRHISISNSKVGRNMCYAKF